MDKHGLKRRKILSFFGLGLAGTVGASIFSRTQERSGVKQTLGSIGSIAQATGIKQSTLPEFTGISQWLNSSPLTISDLKGKVILVQFWAFGCINSQRTLPYITAWHKKYVDRGLQVVGVHAPEFDFERDVNNVKDALKKYDITYPVAIDNDFKTWKAYQNRYWPHLFLADRNGVMTYHHIGEGAYQETEQKIQQLLG